MTEEEMHHTMEHFVWSRPQYFNNCTEEESCRPLDQCGGDDLGESGFPYMCGWDGGSKQYKYCCSGRGENLDIEDSSAATKGVELMGDHVKECKTQAENSPEGCQDPKNPSFVLMNNACMKSCNARKVSNGCWLSKGVSQPLSYFCPQSRLRPTYVLTYSYV